MPSSEYASAVSGGLRLKGAGIDKKKTKKKKPPPSAERSKPEIEAGSTANKEEQEIKRLDTDNDPTALQQALADEEEKAKEAAAKLQDVEGRDYGKTEAQRRYEQRRKKRVSTIISIYFFALPCQAG